MFFSQSSSFMKLELWHKWYRADRRMGRKQRGRYQSKSIESYFRGCLIGFCFTGEKGKILYLYNVYNHFFLLTLRQCFYIFKCASFSSFFENFQEISSILFVQTNDQNLPFLWEENIIKNIVFRAIIVYY